MNYEVSVPPGEDVVSVDEAKTHMRVDHDDDDAYIEALISVATGKLDGPRGTLGRCLVNQTIEARADRFPCGAIELRYPPVVEITAVKYDDDAGVEQTLDASGYRLAGSKDAPRLYPASGTSWPATACQPEAVRVTYIAGFGEAGSDVPSPIRQAVLQIVADLYENREATSDRSRTEMPFSATDLLSGYRLIYLS